LSTKAIPGYIIKKKLGAGAMATVFLAKEEKLHRNVALKVMSKKLLSDPSFADRFLREARIVASISHRNIVTVFDVGSQNDYHYMAMELLPGGDLTAKLKNGIPLEEAISNVIDIAQGLQHAGSKKLIHRDIKPDNIMFAEDGRAVITDFGIARDASLESNMTIAGSVIGTPQYMSPEQAGGKELDHRTDLYSLGIILYQILTGSTPFKGDSAISTGVMHITQPVPPLPVKYGQFQGFIDVALAKNPDDRFQSGKEFIEALSKVSLEAFEEEDVATLLMSSEEINKAVKASGVQKQQDLMSDLSDEFLTSEPTPIPESSTQKEKSNSIYSPAFNENESLTGLSLSDIADNNISQVIVEKEKRDFSFRLPRSLTILLVFIFVTVGGHIFYVNILGKAIPFKTFTNSLENLTYQALGKRPNLSATARNLANASISFGNTSDDLFGAVLPERKPILRLTVKEKQIVELLDQAIEERRLYYPPFDCAAQYLQDLRLINANSEVVKLRTKELLALTLEMTLEYINTKQFDKAKQLMSRSKPLLKYVNGSKLSRRHRQLSSQLIILG
jgi:serine/threonine protein kinase